MSRRGTLSCALVVALLVLGCSTAAPSTDTYEPGVSGGVIDGHVEVFVVDEATGAPIASSIEVVLADGTIAAQEDGDGRFVVDDDALVAPLAIRVTGVDRPQAITGIAGARVVVPIAVPRVRAIEGRVLGADSLGASDVVVGALAPPSFFRTDALERGVPTACADDPTEGCRFRIERASASSDTVVATLRDAEGRAIAFGVGAIEEGDLSLVDPAMRAPALAVTIPSPSAPPPGLAAVVGVPGLATPSGVVFLTQTTTADAMIGVPELAGAIGDGTWWLLADAGPSLVDRSRRSVVVQRGLRDPADVGLWPAWLPPPTARVDGGVVTIEPAEGATLYAIDWLAPGGAVLASALVLDPSAPILFAPAIVADAIRVRAIDAPGASPSALDLRAVERSVVRFADLTL